MNGEQKFWVSVWIVIGAIIIGVSSLIYASNAHEDDIVESIVKEGYTPIEARCAFGYSADDAVCITFIHNKEGK